MTNFNYAPPPAAAQGRKGLRVEYGVTETPGMKTFALGIDLGGTLIKAAAVSPEGKILTKARVPTRRADGPAVAVRQMAAFARELSAKVRGRKLAGMGVGIPGPLDRRTPNVVRLTNFPGWEGYPLKSALEKELGRPVVMENDANLAAVGEQWMGAAKKMSSFLFVTLGTGVGGGLVLDGKLWTGVWGLAGEFGHVKVEPDGLACGCGSRGCVEMHASGTAIVRMAKGVLGHGGKSGAFVRSPLYRLSGGNPDSVDAALVCDAARQGDEAAIEIYRLVGRYLGQALADVVNLLDIRDFLFGGGISNAFDVFHPYLHEELRRKVYGQSTEGITVERSLLGEDAGVLGAARLAFQKSAASPRRGH